MTRPTPETDAQFANMGAAPDKSYVRAEFARKLERERDEAREAASAAAREVVYLATLMRNHKGVNTHPFPMAVELEMYRQSEAAIAEYKSKGWPELEARSREGGEG